MQNHGVIVMEFCMEATNCMQNHAISIILIRHLYFQYPS